MYNTKNKMRIYNAIVGGSIAACYGLMTGVLWSSELPGEVYGLRILFAVVAAILTSLVGVRFGLRSAKGLLRGFMSGQLPGAVYIFVLTCCVGLVVAATRDYSMYAGERVATDDLSWYFYLGIFLSLLGAISGGALFGLIELLCIVPFRSTEKQLASLPRKAAAIYACCCAFLFAALCFFYLQCQHTYRWAIAIFASLPTWWFCYHLFIKVRLMKFRALIYGPIAGTALAVFTVIVADLIESEIVKGMPRSLDETPTDFQILFIGALVGFVYAIIALATQSFVRPRETSPSAKEYCSHSADHSD